MTRADKTSDRDDKSDSTCIDEKIAKLADWRGALLARLRTLILESDPRVSERIMWRKPSNPSGTAAWQCAGLLCTGEVYKDKVKVTFAQGAALDDDAGLFNNSLDGNVRRAIDFKEGDALNAAAFKVLIRSAVALNVSRRAP